MQLHVIVCVIRLCPDSVINIMLLFSSDTIFVSSI